LKEPASVARVGLVPSPIGLRRYGVTIDAVFDEELLHQSDKLTFTKKKPAASAEV
jgi:hypothetical protein